MSTEIGAWVQAALAAPAITKKLERLQATRRPERHLFLRVHDSAPSDQMLHALCFSDQVPAERLEPTHGLTGLWVAPRWGTPLRWLAGADWVRFELGE
jgi:hypothetical protein